MSSLYRTKPQAGAPNRSIHHIFPNRGSNDSRPHALEEAERFKADLIVLAASGRSRVARFFVGSTADRVIRQASCPVLVVPADAR